MKSALLADAVAENIAGSQAASHFLARLPGELLDPDELMRALLLAHQASPARLRGFCRRIQKQLERAD